MFMLMKVFCCITQVVKCMNLGFFRPVMAPSGDRGESEEDVDIHHVLDIHKFRSIQKYLFPALKAKKRLGISAEERKKSRKRKNEKS